MHLTSYDFRNFYNTFGGRILRRIIRDHIQDFWPDVKGLRVLGYGYAVPYLRPYLGEAERVFAIMPAIHGALNWPPEGKSLVCLSGEAELPLETNSIDRILLIHSLEFTESMRLLFDELSRVLKSNGRILIVVPNRIGLWARAEWSPFGQGRPYSLSQIEHFLRDHLFVHERTKNALFVPPVRSNIFLRSAGSFEKMGPYILPGMGGLNFVEASKQIYAGRAIPARSHATAKARPAIATNPTPKNLREASV